MFKFSLDLLELKVGRPLLAQLLQGGVDLLVEDVVDLFQPGDSVLSIIMINFLKDVFNTVLTNPGVSAVLPSD